MKPSIALTHEPSQSHDVTALSHSDIEVSPHSQISHTSNSTSSSAFTESQSDTCIALDKGIDTSSEGNQSVPDIAVLRKQRAGMTVSGGDIFPTKLYNRFSVDSDTLIQPGKTSPAGGRDPSNKTESPPQKEAPQTQASLPVDRPTARVQKSGSFLVQRPEQSRSKSLEKSPSDPNLKEYEHRARSVSQERPHARPRNPPSYEEAIMRRSQRNGSPAGKPASVLEIRVTDQDILQQQQNSQRARQLYEDSLKRYESRPSVDPACCSPHKNHHRQVPVPPKIVLNSEKAPTEDRPAKIAAPQRRKLPSYEQACQRAALIREQHERDAQKTQPPPYEKPSNQQSHKDVVNSQSQQPKNKHPERSASFSAHEDVVQSSVTHRSRESTVSTHPMIEKHRISRSASEKIRERRSQSRSRERRIIHRYSDPKMSDVDPQIRAASLNRSKSDSSEHLEKALKFQNLQTYENKENISMEDLAKEARASRSISERRQSDERIKTRSEDSAIRRRSMPPASLLSNTGPVSAQPEEAVRTSRARRQSVPSMKNRDWHKELAEQYESSYSNNKSASSTSSSNPVVQYAYVAPVSKEKQPVEESRSTRRWVPPVHPTKDLIYSGLKKDKPSQNGHRAVTRSHSGPRKDSGVPQNTAHDSTGSTKSQSALNSNRRERSSSDAASLRKNNNASDSSAKTAQDSERRSNARHGVRTDSKDHSASTASHKKDSKFVESEPAKVGWSVAKLRNLYNPDGRGSQGSHQASQPGTVLTAKNGNSQSYRTETNNNSISVYSGGRRLPTQPSVKGYRSTNGQTNTRNNNNGGAYV